MLAEMAQTDFVFWMAMFLILFVGIGRARRNRGRR